MINTSIPLGLAIAFLTPAALSQDPVPEPAPALTRATAWPTLRKTQQQRIDVALKTLRTTEKAERRDSAMRELVELGAGVAPFLVRRLTDYRVNMNEDLVTILGQITTAEHATLLARHATDNKAIVRKYVLQRLTAFHLPEMAPVFRKALADSDEDIAFQAALGLASAGDLGGMAAIFGASLEDWHGNRERVATALEGARGVKASTWIVNKMTSGGERTLVTGLRLLRSVASKDSAGLIKPHLDSPSHSIRKAAINALRVIVDGQPPLERLSVFEAINLARDWRAKV